VWQDSTQCSRSCGGGTKQQSRSCTNPVPYCGGVNCLGKKHRTVTCNEKHCPGMHINIQGMICGSVSHHSVLLCLLA